MLIQVALGFLALMAMTTFVFDWGVMWVARRQAQNAADAGALAGAVALAFDGGGSFGNTKLQAEASAYAMASTNLVWGQQPDQAANTVNATYPEVCPDGTTTCLRVDVYRNAERGNPLPVFFGQLVGLSQQGVKATATAQAAIADSSDCLKPWAIPDRWTEHTPVDSGALSVPGDTFDTVVDKGPNKGAPLVPPDTYQKFGYTLDNAYGMLVTLKNSDPQQTIAPGNFFPICLPSIFGNCGGDVYRSNIEECNGVLIEIGDEGVDITTEPGNMIGPTSQGVQFLIAKDPSAYWDDDAKIVVTTNPENPRVVAVPVFDPAVFDEGKQNGRTVFHIVNILGFFIEDMVDQDVVGRFVTMPAQKFGTGPSPVDPQASFLKSPILVK